MSKLGRAMRHDTATVGQTPGEFGRLLSVCMIVRNEAHHLEACLRSVAPVADEIVVVDTGSRDGSQEIVRRFGGRVYEHAWRNDFSLHRNQSISYATAEWILQIDADERLAPESARGLRDFLESAPAEVNGFMIRLENIDRQGRRNAVFRYPRLFRNGVGVYYHGAVHNQVVIPGRVEGSEIVLRHLGYNLEPDQLSRKVSRTEALLLARLERDPNDLSALCNLAHTYSMARQPERCVAVGERAIALLEQQDSPAPSLVGVYYPVVAAYMTTGHYDRGLELCDAGLRRLPWYVDLHYQRTRGLAKCHRYSAVLTSGEGYHRAREQVLHHPEHMLTLVFYTLDLAYRVDYWQGLAALAVGDWQRADLHLCRALSSPELTPATAQELLQNLTRVQRTPLSEHWIQKCLCRYPALETKNL